MYDANSSLETKRRKQLFWLSRGESTERLQSWLSNIHEQLHSSNTAAAGGGVCSMGVNKNKGFIGRSCPVYKYMKADLH